MHVPVGQLEPGLPCLTSTFSNKTCHLDTLCLEDQLSSIYVDKFFFHCMELWLVTTTGYQDIKRRKLPQKFIFKGGKQKHKVQS